MKDKVIAARWDAVVEEMRHLLIQCARDQETVTYSELSRMIQTAHIHYHSHILVRLLDQLGNEEEAEGRPCLPALVVTKQTGMPGGGFFTGLAHEFSEDPDALEAYWRAKVKEVFDYWAE
jgi:hypothetical protein